MKRARTRSLHAYAHLCRRLAVRADGAILLSTEELDNRNLAGCEVETYVTLRPDQTAIARKCLGECIAEGSAKLASAFPKKEERAGRSIKKASVNTSNVGRDKKRSP